MKKLRVLCLDIEGGFGGSSRSLYESIAHMDRTKLDLSIWCKAAGPIQDKYRNLGAAVTVHPKMPKVSSLPRLSRNIIVYLRFISDWVKSRYFRKKLLEASQIADVVHFNHESLFWLARWLKPRTNAKLSMHIRTNLYGTIFCRFQIRCIAKTIHKLIFITENERSTLGRITGLPITGDVIHNIVDLKEHKPHIVVPSDDRFKVASLSNFAWVRGVDRCAEIARALKDQGRNDILFILAGKMYMPRTLPGPCGRAARKGKTFDDFIAECGLSDMFVFLGHVINPENVLASCNALIKPTRESNPWGRDILEGLAAGKPVISVGTYDKFVEDGVTGFLNHDFDAGAIAANIISLADNPVLEKKMGAAGRKRVAELCNGKARAKDLLIAWQSTVAG